MSPGRLSDGAEVVVIGGGLSGLSAAKYLQERDVKVVVLEARDRVGGRTFTKQDARFGWVDLGASYVGPSQRHILRLAKEMGVKTYSVPHQGKYTFFFKGKPMHYTGHWPHCNPLDWLDVHNMIRQLDNMAQQVPSDAPWAAARAEEWDRMTVQEWLNRVCWTRAAQEWGRQYVTANVTMEPWEVSLLWLLWYTKSAGGVSSIWEMGGAAQDMKFVGGTQQISENMAEHLAGSVKLSNPVCKTSQWKDGVSVATTGGDVYQAQYIIMALAPHLQGKIHYDPPLPSRRNQLIQRLPMGSCIKTQTWYNRAFWRETGLSGIAHSADGVTMVGDTCDDTQENGALPALTGFITGDMAREAGDWSKEERKRTTIKCHEDFFQSKEAREVVHYEDYSWMDEQYTGGCFTSTYPPGALTKFGFVLRKPFHRMYFAGTEMAVQWSGYMDGAVSAGERAAREVLHAMGRVEQEEVWSPMEDLPDPYAEEGTWWLEHSPSIGALIHGSCLLVLAISAFGVVCRTRPQMLHLPSWVYK